MLSAKMDSTAELLAIHKAVLACLYLHDQLVGTQIQGKEVLQRISDKTNISPNSYGFGLLRVDGLVETSVSSSGSRYYAITEEGTKLLERSLVSDPELRHIIEVLEGPLGPDALRDEVIPASDRAVSINHNSPDFEHLQSSLTTTLEEIRKLNDLDEKDQMMAAQLRGSLEIAQAPTVSAELIERVMITALRYFADKFVSSAVGIAASAALVLAMKFFGFV